MSYNNLKQKTKHFRLKESIRHRGLIEPLAVTRHPKTGDLVPYGGGKTRLSLLEALHRETGDSKYAVAECVEHPPCDPKTLALSQLIQNRVWKRKRFVVTAIVVFELLQRQEQQSQRTFTETQARRWLHQQGYYITKTRFNQMHFVARVLSPVLPRALASTLNKTEVLRIRKLYSSMKLIWKKFANRDDPFAEAFSETCKLADSRTWDIAYFRDILEREIAISCTFTLQDVRLLLGIPISELNKVLEEYRCRDKRAPSQSSVRHCEKPRSSPRSVGENRLVSADNKLPRDASIAACKRRRNYTRTLAVELASNAKILHCLDLRHDSDLGYSVICRPNSGTRYPALVIWNYLLVCEQIAKGDDTKQKCVDPAWTIVEDDDWDQLKELISISRSIGLTRRHPRILSQPRHKAA